MLLSKSDESISPALASWASQCPNPGELAQVLGIALFRCGFAECNECGERMPRSDLRFDASYFETGELICRSCWTLFDCGTMARPEFKAPAWPARLDLSDQKPKMKGIMRLGGKAIGTVTNYVAGAHFGKVSLFAHPESAEVGSLDPDVRVTDLEPMSTEDDGEGTLCRHVRDANDVFNLVLRATGQTT